MFLVCADADLDAVVASTEKLSHPTASRPRVTDRRPRSQIITPVRLCSQTVMILSPTYWSTITVMIYLFLPVSLSQSSLSTIDLDPPAVEDRKEKNRAKEEPETFSRSIDVSLRKGVPTVSVRPTSLHRLALFVSSSRGQHSTDLMFSSFKSFFFVPHKHLR